MCIKRKKLNLLLICVIFLEIIICKEGFCYTGKCLRVPLITREREVDSIILQGVYLPEKYRKKMVAWSEIKKKRYEDRYTWFCKELGIKSADDIEKLKHNLATASYYLAKQNITEEEINRVLKIYGENFYTGEDIKKKDIRTKKQLIIAVYAVGMKKADESLQKSIDIYKREFGITDISKLDDDTKKQLIIAVYKVGMNKADASLSKTLKILKDRTMITLCDKIIFSWRIVVLKMEDNAIQKNIIDSINSGESLKNIKARLGEEIFGHGPINRNLELHSAL
jgi:hypothetical protein